jgi:hypothetical protein
MILVDTNLLIYAYVTAFPQHRIAKKWLDDALSGRTQVGLPWPSLLGFVRIVINPRVFETPGSVGEAWGQVLEWLSCDVAWIPQATERHSEVLGELLAFIGMQANLVPDAHLAALALEHGLTLCSADTDFARFPGLRWTNPLAQ